MCALQVAERITSHLCCARPEQCIQALRGAALMHVPKTDAHTAECKRGCSQQPRQMIMLSAPKIHAVSSELPCFYRAFGKGRELTRLGSMQAKAMHIPQRHRHDRQGARAAAARNERARIASAIDLHLRRARALGAIQNVPLHSRLNLWVPCTCRAWACAGQVDWTNTERGHDGLLRGDEEQRVPCEGV